MTSPLGPGPPRAAARRFQILALSGGGMRGLYTASVLEALEARVERPLAGCFDLIAGTSIGGIIALGLALGREARCVREQVEAVGPRLFPPRERRWRRVKGLFGARHDPRPLAELVTSVLGSDSVLASLGCPVVVPALALTNGGTQLFRTPHHRAHHAQAATRLVDVALSTAAAPGLFPVARVGDVEYLDGGLIANAPDALALSEAATFFAKPTSDVFMLSVGTTTDLAALAAGGRRSRGLLYWFGRGRLPELVMSAQQQLSAQLVREALGERYMTINSPRSRAQAAVIALDRADARAVSTLKSMALHAAEAAFEDPRVNQFLSHRAADHRHAWPEPA